MDYNLTRYLPVISYAVIELKPKFYIKKISTKKIFYKRRDYEAVAEKQQFNTARTKIPPPVIREVTG